MPRPDQQVQRAPAAAAAASRHNGQAALDGHGSDGHAPMGDGQVSHGSPEPDSHLVDVAALLAENEGLRQRLASQPVIEQAKGILMGHYGINSDTAFQLLRRWSQESNTKIRRIAELLTESAASGAEGRPAPHQIVPSTAAAGTTAPTTVPTRRPGQN